MGLLSPIWWGVVGSPVMSGGGDGIMPMYLEWDEEISRFSLNGVYYDGFDAWWAAVGGEYSRSGDKRYIDSAGVMQIAGANVWPAEYDPADLSVRGRTVHPAVTARGTARRDLTDAAWTKTNGTAAKDQIGIDGVANAASSFEATSANATCIQTVTDATSRNRCLPVFIKRLVGTGAVELTVDGGSTWTAITTRLVQDEWADCIISKAAVTNPGFGVRLATSGDKIAWDFGRVVDGYFPGPPLADGETNSADAVSIPVAGLTKFVQGSGMIAVRAMDSREDTATGGDLAAVYTDNANCVLISRQNNGAAIGQVVLANSFIATAQSTAGNIGPRGARSLRTPNWYAMAYRAAGCTFSSGGFAGSDTSAISDVPAAARIRLGYGRSGQSSLCISGLRLYGAPAADRFGLVAASCTPMPFAVRGDSVAAGANASRSDLEWSALLAKALTPTRTRGDLGVGGSTSAQCLADILTDTDRREQTHLVWTTHNDSGTPEESMANLSAIDALIPHGRVLFATPLINTDIDNSAAITRKQSIRSLMLAAFGTRCVDLQTVFDNNGGTALFSPGEIHPNDAGQVVAFAAWLDAMQTLGW